ASGTHYADSAGGARPPARGLRVRDNPGVPVVRVISGTSAGGRLCRHYRLRVAAQPRVVGAARGGAGAAGWSSRSGRNDPATLPARSGKLHATVPAAGGRLDPLRQLRRAAGGGGARRRTRSGG